MQYLLLFDIDGTILKLKDGFASGLFRQMILELFKKDIPTTGLPNFAGATDLWIIRQIGYRLGFNDYQIDELLPIIYHRIIALFDKSNFDGFIKLMPGIEQMIPALAAMPEFKLGLLTGNIIENAYLKLKHFGLDQYFDVGAFGGDDENRNELPAIAIERANILAGYEAFSKSNTIIIGDTHKDIECGRSNGIAVCAVATGKTTFEDLWVMNPERIYHNFSDYESVIASIRTYFTDKQIKDPG